ncbi:MAG: DUF2190 family protein [Thermoleophilia bacterium]|nr:DUF2190 family protein [Thermoleophilia bacterium]
MENFRQEGEVLTLTAPGGGVVSGTLYKVGSLIVCALITADAAALFTALVAGVITAAKTAGETWSEGEPLYYVAGTKALTTTAGANTLCGVAVAAAASADTTGPARLDGVVR